MDRKIQYACVSAIAFAVISSPAVYKLANSITAPLGLPVSNSAGCPNYTGLAFHGAVMGLVVYVLLYKNFLIPFSA